MTDTLHSRVAIGHPADVGAARRTASAFARERGFTEIESDQVGLVVTELATNLLKHAGGGELLLSRLVDGDRVGLKVEACDSGPGIADVDGALTDRYSTTQTRGAGLGAVNRLMDDMEIVSSPGRGTTVSCHRWVRATVAGDVGSPQLIGVATRPRLVGAPNGDSFVVHHWGGLTLVGVIDGLGHGQFASRAALVARDYVERHFDQPLKQIFRGAGRACRATRGVVMALARFDWRAGRLAFASVGNIETRVLPEARGFTFPVRRGVIGLNAPEAVVWEHPWPADHQLVLHSDGLKSHWQKGDFPGLWEAAPAEIAQRLLRTLGREQDDATVVVVGRRATT